MSHFENAYESMYLIYFGILTSFIFLGATKKTLNIFSSCFSSSSLLTISSSSSYSSSESCLFDFTDNKLETIILLSMILKLSLSFGLLILINEFVFLFHPFSIFERLDGNVILLIDDLENDEFSIQVVLDGSTKDISSCFLHSSKVPFF